MNYAFLPDLVALAILIVILMMLHRRHPQKQADLWLLGLFFTLIEALAHTFYAPTGVPNKYLHLVVVDCYLVAGLVFTLAAGDERIDQKNRLPYIVLNGLPLLAINSLYGLHYHTPTLYFAAIAAGLMVGVTTSIYLRRSWVRAGLQVCGWLAMGFLIRGGHLREVIYWSLCCVYSIAAVNFQRRLPPKSTGKLAIVTGFSIWAMCFLVHPWVVHYSAYVDIASHVWNMQKSLISIGMILMMLEEQLSNNRWLALHDELTGLPNRRLFEERLRCALDRSQRESGRLALLVLDLNGFKKINDTLGHQAGDEVLRGVAKNLREHVKAFEILARLGGDEFTMIASDLQRGAALDQLLEDVRRALQRPLIVEGETMVVSASLGFALYPDDGQDANKLFKVADERMYTLKRRPYLEARMKADSASIDTRISVGNDSGRSGLRVS
jgi:diguanylate cyclase (GGDEF)-like protein